MITSTNVLGTVELKYERECLVLAARFVMNRTYRRYLASLILTVAILFVRLPGPTHAADNPIVIENQQAGTSQWQIPWGSAATDSGGQIKGYASAASVNKG